MLQINKNIYFACNQGDLWSIKDLVAEGADINTKYDFGYTLLHYAASNGALHILKYLLENGADIEAVTTTDGWTPLHIAVSKKAVDPVAYLLRFNANIEARTKKQETPLHLAIINGNCCVLDYLIEKGANIEALNILGKTPLYIVNYNLLLDHMQRVLMTSSLVKAGAVFDLTTLIRYPSIVLPKIHENLKTGNIWYSALLFILQEQSKFNNEGFKELIKEFLNNEEDEIPENIKIILRTLI